MQLAGVRGSLERSLRKLNGKKSLTARTHVWYSRGAMITAPSPFPDVEAMEPERAAVRELAAHIYSAQAELALKVARLDDDGGWAGDGYLSIVHWLSIHLGLGRVSARELVRVGHALVELPRVAEAFASGSLSYDKVRFICQVATPEDQEVWVELAQGISGSQLIKICLGYRRAKEADSGERAEAQLARRGLWTFKEEDGMVRLTALLPAEDAAVVMTAIEAVAAEQPPVPIQDTSALPDPAEDRWAARQADSLVAICRQAGDLVSDPEPCQLVVHVDLGVLTGDDPQAATWKTAPQSRPRWLGAWAAKPRWWPSPSGTGCLSTSAAAGACLQGPSAGPCRPATAPAASRAAGCRRGAPISTTSSPGSWAAPPTWLMPRACAGSTMDGSTRVVIRSWAAQTVSCASRPATAGRSCRPTGDRPHKRRDRSSAPAGQGARPPDRGHDAHGPGRWAAP